MAEFKLSGYGFIVTLSDVAEAILSRDRKVATGVNIEYFAQDYTDFMQSLRERIDGGDDVYGEPERDFADAIRHSNLGFIKDGFLFRVTAFRYLTSIYNFSESIESRIDDLPNYDDYFCLVYDAFRLTFSGSDDDPVLRTKGAIDIRRDSSDFQEQRAIPALKSLADDYGRPVFWFSVHR